MTIMNSTCLTLCPIQTLLFLLLLPAPLLPTPTPLHRVCVIAVAQVADLYAQAVSLAIGFMSCPANCSGSGCRLAYPSCGSCCWISCLVLLTAGGQAADLHALVGFMAALTNADADGRILVDYQAANLKFVLLNAAAHFAQVSSATIPLSDVPASSVWKVSGGSNTEEVCCVMPCQMSRCQHSSDRAGSPVTHTMCGLVQQF